MSIKVGLLDLDTSHPQNWVPIIRELGYEVAGVYDGGTVHDEGYATEFAREHGIENVYASPQEMAEDVDVAIIHSCNWERHVPLARAFVANGKGVILDKPMVGNLQDVETLLSWHRAGARITGGSSLLYCEELQAYLRKQQAPILHAVAGCSVDEFNYGIHGYALLIGLMGPKVKSVQSVGTHVQHHVQLVWENGAIGYVMVGGTDGYIPFHTTIVHAGHVEHIIVDSGRLYRALLEQALPYAAGTAAAYWPLDELIVVEKAALAARLSARNGGVCIQLDQLLEYSDSGLARYEGSAFAASYRAQKRNSSH